MSEVRNLSLKAAREKSGKTQAQVAKEAGLDVRNYQRYEYGMNMKAMQAGIRIAKALGRNVETLWSGNSAR